MGLQFLSRQPKHQTLSLPLYLCRATNENRRFFVDHHYGGKEARLSEVAANNFQTRLLRRFSPANAPLLFITDPSLSLNRVRLTFHRVFAILSFIERAIRDETTRISSG